jgi:hypothetical protein
MMHVGKESESIHKQFDNLMQAMSNLTQTID